MALIYADGETGGFVLYEDGYLWIFDYGVFSNKQIEIIKSMCSCPITEIEMAGFYSEIEEDAFRGMTSLRKVTLCDSVTKIGSGAFRFCEKLEEVNLSSNLEVVDNRAFSECSSLKSVYLPDSVTTLGPNVFYGCSSLTDVHLPSGLKRIPNGMFDGCSSLTEMEIPSGVKQVGYEAFQGCTGLSELHGGNFKKIEFSAFASCSSLKHIGMREGMTMIENDAFLNCSSLESVEIPDTVTAVGDRAFSGCSSLTEVTLPENVTSIGDLAFHDCPNLKNLHVLSRQVEHVGEHAFGFTGNTTYETVNGFTVRGYGNDAVQAYAKENGIKYAYFQLPTPVLQNVVNKAAGIQIVWEAVEGAVDYRVLKKDASGSWKKLADVKGTSFVDKTAQNGETCCYTVRCITSDQSAAISKYNENGMEIVYLTRPVISSCSNTAEGEVKVKWNLNKAADGYVVRYTANGVKKTKTYKNGAKVSCVLKNLTKEASYKVEIRSFKQGVDGRSYSGWSTAKTVKVTK